MIDINNPLQLLGKISAKDFMQNYWQKKPLLIRSAIANYKPNISKNQLFELTQQEGINTRFIMQNNKTKKWIIKHAPLSFDIKKIEHKKDPWTILVSNVNEYNDEIYNFLQQ